MSKSKQQTIENPVSLHGVGVHSGKDVSVCLLPADADTGIVVQRENVAGEVTVDWTKVTSSSLCTVLGDPATNGVATVEHLLAALHGLGIDNVLIEVDAGEVPILDGSAEPFVEAIDQAGIREQSVEQRYIRILKPVRVEFDDRYSQLLPCEVSRFDITIDFDSPVIGRQNFACDLTPDSFRREIARARTFGFVSDANSSWAKGYQLGSSLENSVVIDKDAVLNPEGLRWPDEFVRHKMLDAIGDLALAGMPIQGLYSSYKGGHRLNFEIVKKLFEDQSSYEIVEPLAGHNENSVEMPSRMSAAAF